MKIVTEYTNFLGGGSIFDIKAMLVFNYQYPSYLSVQTHRVTWVDSVKNRPSIVGQWRVHFKN